ncbi:MAG: hypothetical protein IJU48_03925 [Synergistaceae bacterium]|nr:hypothetical protein [Synergistaceae bacterium]
MKKFLALFVVVLMLAFAGSAFAADSDGGHTNPTQPVEQKTETETVQNVIVVNEQYQVNVTTEAVTNNVSTTTATQVENQMSSITSLLGKGSSSSTLVDNTTTVTLTTTYTAAQTAARMQQASGGTRQAIGSMPSFGATQTGPMAMILPTFNPVYYGMKLFLNLFGRGKLGGGSVSSAATGTVTGDDSDAVFLNSNGEIITTVPDGSNGEVAGQVTAVAYVEAGEEYDPILSVNKAEADAAEIPTQTVDSVTYNDITYEPVEEPDTPSGGSLGSSGGGCSAAGFGALALALLGGLIARKK